MDVKKLIEERVKLVADDRALIDAVDKRSEKAFTAEEKEQREKRNKRIAELRELIDAEAETLAEERSLSESMGRKTDVRQGEGTTDRDRDLALRGWALGRRATAEMREAADKLGIDLDAPNFDVALVGGKYAQVRANSHGDIETRALSVGTTTAGGNWVPTTMLNAYNEAQKWFGAVQERAQVINTESGANLDYPCITDTSNTGEVLAEATAATTTADPTFSKVTLGAFKVSSKAVLVSWELLQDSQFDLASYLGRALGRRVGRLKNTKFTVGAGTTEPKGVTLTTVGKTASATNAFTADEVIDLIHSVDPAYRNLPDVCFMAHDSTIAYIRKLKDGNARYIWEPSTQIGVPDRLFGYPIVPNNDVSSSIATGEHIIVFGSMGTGFVVRLAGAARFVRDESIKVAEHQVYFEAIERVDSNIVDTTAVKILELA